MGAYDAIATPGKGYTAEPNPDEPPAPGVPTPPDTSAAAKSYSDIAVDPNARQEASDEKTDWWAALGAPGYQPVKRDDQGNIIRDEKGNPVFEPLKLDQGDIEKGVGSGLVRHMYGIAALPGNLESLALDAARWAAQTGYKEKVKPFQETLPKWLQLPTSEDYAKRNRDVFGTDFGYSFQPTTPVGKAAQFAMGFGPTKVGQAAAAVTAVPHYLVPDTDPNKEAYELVGSIIGGGGTAAVTKPTATEVLSNRVKDVDPAAFARARDLQRKANEIGVPLSGAEIMQEVTDSGTGLGKLQRYLEGTKAYPKFAKFYADRAQEVKDATNRALLKIGEVVKDPSQVGPAVQRAAQKTIEETRQEINAMAQPFYLASHGDVVPPSNFVKLWRDPIWRAAFDDIKNTPEFRKAHKGKYPVNDIRIVDEVKKVLDKKGVPRVGETAIENWQRGMGEKTRENTRAFAGEASEPYDIAVKIGEHGREGVLQPMLDSQIGKLAETSDLTTQAGVILPKNPARNESLEIGNAIDELQKRDPTAARDLATVHLRQTLDEQTKSNVGGSNQWGGAKFNAVLRGNGTRGEVVETVVRRVAGNAAWEGFQKVLDVLQATGKRLSEGSPTEPNALFKQEIKADSSRLPELAATVFSPRRWLDVKGMLEDWRYGRRIHQITNILLSPDSIAQLERIAKMSNTGDRIRRAVFQLLVGAGVNANDGGNTTKR